MVATPLYLVTLVATALSVAAAPHHKRAPDAASNAAAALDLAGLEPRVVLANASSSLSSSLAAPAPLGPVSALLPSATATATTPSVALVTSLALSSELRALVKRNAPYEHFAALVARQLPASESEIDVHSLYLSLVRSRALSGEVPTPWTPGQSARYSALARSRASVTSSMRRAGTCRVTSDCVTTAPANANTSCDDGKCSYRASSSPVPPALLLDDASTDACFHSCRLPIGLRRHGLVLRLALVLDHDQEEHDDDDQEDDDDDNDQDQDDDDNQGALDADVRRQLGLQQLGAGQLEPVLRRRQVLVPCVPLLPRSFFET